MTSPTARPWLLLLLLITAFSAKAQPATNSEIKEIRREMEDLKKEYELRMQRLEERLQKFEKPTPPSPATNAVAPTIVALPPATNALPPAIVAVPLAATNSAGTNQSKAAQLAALERGRAYANAEFPQNGTLDRDLLAPTNHPLKERFEQVLQDFVEIGGYVRAGYGQNNQGGPQVAFQAPGALAKYRLGNEAENYGELILGKNWYVPGMFSLDPKERADGTPSGPVAHAQIRLSFYNPYSSYNSAQNTQFAAPEAWAAIGNVVESQPSMKFWAGDRFYRRRDIYIDDFFFYNMSGGGGGVEDFELPFGKVALAWIGNGSQSDLYTDIPSPTPANKAGFSKGNWDLSLYDIPVPLGKAEISFVYATADMGLDQYGRSLPGTDGGAVSFLHEAKPFLDKTGFNLFCVQLGSGPAKTFTSGFETFNFNGNTYIRPDPDNSWRLRVTEHFVVQPCAHFSIGPALVYQHTDYGDSIGQQDWFSTGVRPIWEINKFFSIAVEGGVDYVANSVSSSSGNLWKLSFAPQVSLGNQFFSRPVLRAFVTYAHWSNDFVGQVGGQDYQGLNEGLTYGVQMEAWW
jgi:maltoporin